MESLDRPYDDHDDDYLTVGPEGPGAESGQGTGDLVRDEEAAAAAEARAIVGVPADEPVSTPDDEHLRNREGFEAVEQVGGGEAEGFEQSEQLLIEHAWNAPEPERTLDAFDLEDPGTDVDPDAADTVAKNLSDADRDEKGTLEHDERASRSCVDARPLGTNSRSATRPVRVDAVHRHHVGVREVQTGRCANTRRLRYARKAVVVDTQPTAARLRAVARTWLSIRVDLIEGHAERLWPRPGRIYAAARAHTFADLADAIDTAFARWDRSHLTLFDLADGDCIYGPIEWHEPPENGVFDRGSG